MYTLKQSEKCSGHLILNGFENMLRNNDRDYAESD